MYSRPLYQTKSHQDAVGSVIEAANLRWPKARFVPQSIDKRASHAVYGASGKLRAYAIVKCRKQSLAQIEQWGGYELSADKWFSVCDLCVEEGVKLILIVSFGGDIRYAFFEDPYPVLKVRTGGRRDRGDARDIEEMVVFPGSLFKKLNAN